MKPSNTAVWIENCGIIERLLSNVKGIIGHFCKHYNKRLKIIDADSEYGIKIKLGERIPKVNSLITGKKVLVTGKLIPTHFNKEAVKSWLDRFKESHKDEEGTDHYNEELADIEAIYIYNKLCRVKFLIIRSIYLVSA